MKDSTQQLLSNAEETLNAAQVFSRKIICGTQSTAHTTLTSSSTIGANF